MELCGIKAHPVNVVIFKRGRFDWNFYERKSQTVVGNWVILSSLLFRIHHFIDTVWQAARILT